MYVGVPMNYYCNGCGWFGGITAPLGYYLKILCPMCDLLLEDVTDNG